MDLSDPVIEFTIEGEPASKANARRAVIIGGKPRFIKSKKALDYVRMFAEQCPTLDPLITGDCWVHIEIYYRTRRPDLDESLILDCMQGCIYGNDRQVKFKCVQHGIDRDEPRSRIRVGLMASGDQPSHS